MPEQRPIRSRENDEWAHADLEAIARVLRETTGLLFPPNRREPAEAGIRRAMHQLGLDAFELQRAIAVPGDARDALVTELTVGETYFFREPGQLDYLRMRVLPELRDAIGATRPLRVWSAGCATGEEPYSLAMTLRDFAWPGAIALLATDIVPARLAVARRGRYTKWSMRGVPEEDVARYLDRQGDYYVVRDAVRESVEFRVLNLADDTYPSPASGIADFDVIFCRNVLIYFDRPTVEAIVRRLLASLVPNGWLFLGASDPAFADCVPCEVVLTGAGLAYRRLAAGASSETIVKPPLDTSHDVAPVTSPAPAVPSFGDATLDVVPAIAADAPRTASADGRAPLSSQPEARIDADAAGVAAAAYERGDYDAAARAAQEAIESTTSTDRTWVLLVRSHANAGHLAAAGEAVAAALDRHQLSGELRYLEGMLLAQGGRPLDAIPAFRRALYLDPNLAVAHLALGDALGVAGDPAAARRAYANAESILRAAPPDAPVPGADGAPAARLLRIARFHLQSSSSSTATATGSV